MFTVALDQRRRTHDISGTCGTHRALERDANASCISVARFFMALLSGAPGKYMQLVAQSRHSTTA